MASVPAVNTAAASGAPRELDRRDWAWRLALALPSLYLLASVPPFWRDTDGFFQIAGTFAPKGIVHWLPGYCLGGRVVMIAGGIVDSLVRGHGLPYLSLGSPELSDAGVWALIIVQHAFLWFALRRTVTTFGGTFPWRCALAAIFVCTPWLYAFAHCVGSEAFSNPWVLLMAAAGWRAFCAPVVRRTEVWACFGLLLAACLTRQINAVLASLVPLACLCGIPFVWWRRRARAGHGEVPVSASALAGGGPGEIVRKGLLRAAGFTALGLVAIVAADGTQRLLCALSRVPYRSTFGETFEWRLSFLARMPEPAREALLERVAARTHDPLTMEAAKSLDGWLARGQPWEDMYLHRTLTAALERRGVTKYQNRAYASNVRLNRLAREFLLDASPELLAAVRDDACRVPFLQQRELAATPPSLTAWLFSQLGDDRFARLRGLASFRVPPEAYARRARFDPYLHLGGAMPLWVWPALASVLGVAAAWRGRWRAAAYAAALLATAFLMVLGTCASTFFAARFHLPFASLTQVAALLAASQAFAPAAGNDRRGVPPTSRSEPISVPYVQG